MIEIRNTKTDTNPIVFHANGKARRYGAWKYLKRNIDQLRIDNFNDDITIVTWNTNRETTPLEDELKALHIPYFNLAQDGKWYHMRKAESVIEHRDLLKTKYIMALDAQDVLINGDMNVMRQSFYDYNCEVLFASEMGNQRRRMKKFGMRHIAEKEKEMNWRYDPFFHLCAGTCFAETEPYLEYISNVIKTSEELGIQESDQLCNRITYLKDEFREKVKIDVKGKYFLTMKYAKEFIEYHES